MKKITALAISLAAALLLATPAASSASTRTVTHVAHVYTEVYDRSGRIWTKCSNPADAYPFKATWSSPDIYWDAHKHRHYIGFYEVAFSWRQVPAPTSLRRVSWSDGKYRCDLEAKFWISGGNPIYLNY